MVIVGSSVKKPLPFSLGTSMDVLMRGGPLVGVLMRYTTFGFPEVTLYVGNDNNAGASRGKT